MAPEPELRQPPPEAHGVARQGVAWLAQHGGLAARLPSGAAVDDLQLTQPHEELTLGLDDLRAGRGLEAASSNGWRYLVSHQDVPLASAVTSTDEAGSTRFAQLDYGPFVAGTTDALRSAAAVPQAQAAHARVLVVPALGVVAAWVDVEDGSSVLVPAAPTPSGITAGQAYPAEELLATLREMAAARPPDEDGVGA